MQAIETAGALDFETRLRRPKRSLGRRVVVSAKVTESERGELDAAALAEGKTLGEWAREALLRAARGGGADPVFTEIIATRMLLNIVLNHVACGEVISDAAFDDVLTEIRLGKHKQAQDVMTQYAAPDQKES